jgi:hypothetical protein
MMVSGRYAGPGVTPGTTLAVGSFTIKEQNAQSMRVQYVVTSQFTSEQMRWNFDNLHSA